MRFIIIVSFLVLITCANTQISYARLEIHNCVDIVKIDSLFKVGVTTEQEVKAVLGEPGYGGVQMVTLDFLKDVEISRALPQTSVGGKYPSGSLQFVDKRFPDLSKVSVGDKYICYTIPSIPGFTVWISLLIGTDGVVKDYLRDYALTPWTGNPDPGCRDLLATHRDDASMPHGNMPEQLGTDQRVFQGLIEDLKSNDCRIQDRAATTLGAMKDTRAIDPLIGALNDTPCPAAEIRLIEALGNFKSKKVAAALISYLNTHDGAVHLILSALKKHQDPEAIYPLLAFASRYGEYDSRRRAVVIELARSEWNASVGMLQEYVINKNESIRAVAKEIVNIKQHGIASLPK